MCPIPVALFSAPLASFGTLHSASIVHPAFNISMRQNTCQTSKSYSQCDSAWASECLSDCSENMFLDPEYAINLSHTLFTVCGLPEHSLIEPSPTGTNSKSAEGRVGIFWQMTCESCQNLIDIVIDFKEELYNYYLFQFRVAEVE